MAYLRDALNARGQAELDDAFSTRIASSRRTLRAESARSSKNDMFKIVGRTRDTLTGAKADETEEETAFALFSSLIVQVALGASAAKLVDVPIGRALASRYARRRYGAHRNFRSLVFGTVLSTGVAMSDFVWFQMTEMLFRANEMLGIIRDIPDDELLLKALHDMGVYRYVPNVLSGDIYNNVVKLLQRVVSGLLTNGINNSNADFMDNLADHLYEIRTRRLLGDDTSIKDMQRMKTSNPRLNPYPKSFKVMAAVIILLTTVATILGVNQVDDDPPSGGDDGDDDDDDNQDGPPGNPPVGAPRGLPYSVHNVEENNRRLQAVLDNALRLVDQAPPPAVQGRSNMPIMRRRYEQKRQKGREHQRFAALSDSENEFKAGPRPAPVAERSRGASQGQNKRHRDDEEDEKGDGQLDRSGGSQEPPPKRHKPRREGVKNKNPPESSAGGEPARKKPRRGTHTPTRAPTRAPTPAPTPDESQGRQQPPGLQAAREGQVPMTGAAAMGGLLWFLNQKN